MERLKGFRVLVKPEHFLLQFALQGIARPKLLVLVLDDAALPERIPVYVVIARDDADSLF